MSCSLVPDASHSIRSPTNCGFHIVALLFTVCIWLALFQFNFSLSAVCLLQLHRLINTRTDTAQIRPFSPPLSPLNHSDTPIFAFDLGQGKVLRASLNNGCPGKVRLCFPVHFHQGMPSGSLLVSLLSVWATP